MEQSWAAAHSRSKPQAGQAPQRIFFGLWPSAATAEQTMAWAHDAHALCGGRVMRPETLHVTLAFLGSTPAARVAELVRAEVGRASCRERVCQYVLIAVVAVDLNKNDISRFIKTNHVLIPKQTDNHKSK